MNTQYSTKSTNFRKLQSALMKESNISIYQVNTGKVEIDLYSNRTSHRSINSETRRSSNNNNKHYGSSTKSSLDFSTKLKNLKLGLLTKGKINKDEFNTSLFSLTSKTNRSRTDFDMLRIPIESHREEIYNTQSMCDNSIYKKKTDNYKKDIVNMLCIDTKLQRDVKNKFSVKNEYKIRSLNCGKR